MVRPLVNVSAGFRPTQDSVRGPVRCIRGLSLVEEGYDRRRLWSTPPDCSKPPLRERRSGRTPGRLSSHQRRRWVHNAGVGSRESAPHQNRRGASCRLRSQSACRLESGLVTCPTRTRIGVCLQIPLEVIPPVAPQQPAGSPGADRSANPARGRTYHGHDDQHRGRERNREHERDEDGREEDRRPHREGDRCHRWAPVRADGGRPGARHEEAALRARYQAAPRGLTHGPVLPRPYRRRRGQPSRRGAVARRRLA